MLKEYLKQSQPVFYKTLFEAFKNDRIPHAFLLCAKTGVNLHDVAMFIAKSLVCKQDILACESCSDCLRVEEGNFADFILLDGKQDKIKKEDIDKITNKFSKTALEGGARIYIIENIEESTVQAMNDLLKFLEEPKEGIYAILTCNNLNRVLPTIQSRCMIVHFKAASKKIIINQAIEKGINQEDANIISQLVDNIDDLIKLESSQLYTDLKVEALNFVEDYFFKRDNLLINTQTHLMKNHNSKQEIQMFLDILMVLIKDILYDAYDNEISFCKHQEFIRSIHASQDKVILMLEKTMEIKDLTQTNVNLNLLIDRFIIEL